jgi:hypothetical protein
MAFPGSRWNSVGAWFPGVSGSWRASCSDIAWNTRTQGQEWGRRACRCPRARRSSPRGRWALERGGPRPRGRLALERGGPRPRERLTLERGGPCPRGHPSCHPDGPRGPPGSWSRRARVLGSCELIRVLRFFVFKRVSPPGYSRDPYGCPRQYSSLKTY